MKSFSKRISSIALFITCQSSVICTFEVKFLMTLGKAGVLGNMSVTKWKECFIASYKKLINWLISYTLFSNQVLVKKHYKRYCDLPSCSLLS